MAKVIIVGNGIIFGRGKFIDKYDKVIRINHLNKPYLAKDRGNKVDIWSLIGSKKDIEGTLKYKPSIKDVWVFSGPHTNQDFKWMRNVRSWLGREPTTGFFTIVRALKDYKKVDIIGFDFFENKQVHYWDDDTPRLMAIRGHDPLREREIIEQWQKHGKVRIIW